ncbi:MAG TPA: ribosome maturation factor RimM [bacterium]|nr:ribosome maturation factor RimM [bacterium]
MPDRSVAETPATIDLDGWVAFGKIVRAHGIRGEVRIHVFPNQPDFLDSVTEIAVQARSGSTQLCRLESLRQAQPDQWLVRLTGFESREQSQALSGATVYIPEDILPQLEEGEYYTFQLLGLRVESEEGETLGMVVDFESMPANDILIVQTTDTRFPLPVVREVILNVDIAGGRIVVSLPEGLLKLEA